MRRNRTGADAGIQDIQNNKGHYFQRHRQQAEQEKLEPRKAAKRHVKPEHLGAVVPARVQPDQFLRSRAALDRIVELSVAVAAA